MIIKNNIIPIFIGLGVVALLFNSSDPVVYGDSQRYLNSSLRDPPLYPAVIAILQGIFKNLNFIIFFQTFFIGFGIIYFTRTVTAYFNLDFLIKILIAFFLFLPILEFYRSILTEPVGYAFSLFLVSFTIKLIYNFNARNLFWNSIFIIALLLTRKQFMFLYPVVLLLYLGIFILYSTRKNLTLLLISFLFIIFSHNILTTLHKHFKQDSFENRTLLTSDSGPFYFTYIDSIYISNEKNIELFENQNIQKTLKDIFKEMNNQKALSKYYNSRGHFSLSFSDIRRYSGPKLENLAIQENTTVINLKKKISIKLIKKNFGKYLKHIFKKFYDSTWLFVFVPFFLMLASFIVFIKHKSNFTLLTIFLSTFTLANHSVVYLFGRVQPRYLIYTDFILLIFVFIAFTVFLQQKNIYSQKI